LEWAVAFGGFDYGLGLLLEGYAFLLEAIFLAFTVGTWHKISGYKHWLLGLPTIPALCCRQYFNKRYAWMQRQWL